MVSLEASARKAPSRRRISRSIHGAFDASARTTSALDLLRESEAGRIPKLLALKHKRMSTSSFSFFRGSVAIMAADLACHPNTGIAVQICGDAHVLNLGAYASFDGRLVFDINDFDETIRAPFEWDIKRMATSLLLAGRSAGISHDSREEAVRLFTGGYRSSMHEFARMPVLQLARYQVHRLEETAPIRSILKTAERSTPVKLLNKLTVEHGERRRFESSPPVLTRVSSKQKNKILEALESYKATLQPERRHFLAQYQPIDAALKVVGTGSVGLRSYCVYFENTSRRPGSDPLFLQLKEEHRSAYAPYLAGEPRYHNQAHRVVDGQRAMQLTSDPLLGFATMEDRDYLVRQLNDHKASLEIDSLTAMHLSTYAEVCGELFARGHARSGDPVHIAEYLGRSDRFDRAILKFARAYADQVEIDWKEFCSRLRP